MTTRAPLDDFETALLTELRTVVAASDGQQVRPRHRKRIAVLAAAVAAAVVAIAVTLGLDATRPSPAYAVADTGAGDIVVTITRLDDAKGLEQALAEHGIKAEVDYDAELFQAEDDTASDPDSFVAGLPVDPCQEGDEFPVQTQNTGDEFVITIDGDSVLPDALLSITTTGDLDGPAGLAVSYTATLLITSAQRAWRGQDARGRPGARGRGPSRGSPDVRAGYEPG